MQHLIDALTKPQILSDGTIREPNAIMRKAADVIMTITALWEQDKQGRIKAENIKVPDFDLETARTMYREAMNRDFFNNYT